MSSGEYKFDNYNEKIDEVELVNDENDSTEWQQSTPNKGGSTGAGGGSMVRVFFLILLLLVIILQVILVGMAGYIITQLTADTECVAGADMAMSNEVTGTQQTTTQVVATCNATEMQDYLNQVIKTINGSTQNILQLLQDQQTMDMDFQANATEMMSNTEDSLEHIINTLSNHKDTSISTSSVVDDILIGINELLDVHNTSSLYDSITPVSCKMIKEKLPDSPSGYYHVNARDIYCNMGELCGSGGGWTRLAYLDMTDSTVDCPDELQYLVYSGVRMCRRPDSGGAGCSPPVKFPSNGISYSEICGRIIGYEKGTPDAVSANIFGPISEHNDLNSYYVDGVSLTKGSPRQHVWTFMSGLWENNYAIHNCPCNNPPGGDQVVQSFVGTHYFCEAGDPYPDLNHNHVFTSDPLWDGKGCGSQEGPCCSVDGLPWFHRQYDNTTTDSLDMRICGDQSTGDEDSPVSFYEIFVK